MRPLKKSRNTFIYLFRDEHFLLGIKILWLGGRAQFLRTFFAVENKATKNLEKNNLCTMITNSDTINIIMDNSDIINIIVGMKRRKQMCLTKLWSIFPGHFEKLNF